MAKSNHSFVPILEKYLKQIKPKNIIEWGPGKSTQIIAATCPESKVITIEHDLIWLEKAIESFKSNSNVRIIHEYADTLCSRYATRAYKYGPYDMAFIDGRRRVECSFVAMDVVKSDGIIILHDCSRTPYRIIIDKYIDKLEEQDDTLVFRKKS